MGACSSIAFFFSATEAAAIPRRRVAVGAAAASLAAAEAEEEVEAQEVEVSSSSSSLAVAAGDLSPPCSAPRPILLPPDTPLALIFAVALLTRMLVSPCASARKTAERAGRRESPF